MSESLKVAVRVRPFIHEYEKAEGVRNIIRMTDSQTVITHPETGVEKTFTFDYSYNSFLAASDPGYASQDTVWGDIGMGCLENAWQGFNVSLFAYGQTGSGKSHSMMGYPGQEGIVPRACREIFERIGRERDAAGEGVGSVAPAAGAARVSGPAARGVAAARHGSGTAFKVEASMLEIYNEKVRDLFNPSGGDGKGLKVRDHPSKGPYVQDLTKVAVDSYAAISRAMDSGTRARTVAATAMNATSSRAHTIFQVVLTQTTEDHASGTAMDKVSVISLIDLAGSERADRTGAAGDRLKEGCAINQSLSALGNVISALADQATLAKKGVVPYRDSVLTHLLKNSLGGNAKTVMVAAISPACVNYEETLSTLRYADRAKQIKNKAVVNEDPHQKVIRGLKEEIELLRAQLQAGASPPGTAEARRMKEEMLESERLLKESELSWDDRLRQSNQQLASQNAALAKLGMVVDEAKKRSVPHLTNLNQDPQMNGVLCYFFEEGLTRVGRKDAPVAQTIVLSGLSILKEHATVSRVKLELAVEALGEARVHLNGKPVRKRQSLAHGDRVVFGNNHVFLVVLPGGGHEAPSCSWEEAMSELNEQQITQLTEGERKARERAEEEAREMQERVAALELRMQEERRRAGAEARAATDAEREKMMLKQRELEKQLQAQIDATTRKQARQDEARRRRALLEESILRTLPLVSEANAISEELRKGRVFSVKLVATQPPQIDVGYGAGAAALLDEEELASRLETSLWIRVHAQGQETPLMWDYEKFVNRLYLMREMYEDLVECGHNLAEVESLYGQEYDPFFDPVEEHLIGKAYVMLTPLQFFIPIEDAPPVIQYQGKTDGALEVQVALDEEQVAELGVVDADEEKTLADVKGAKIRINVRVIAAKGLPKRTCAKVAVSYKLLNQTFRTPPCEGESINPRFDHVDRIDLLVTEELIQYVQKQPLEFQVWGCAVPASPQTGSPGAPAASPAGLKALGEAASPGALGRGLGSPGSPAPLDSDESKRRAKRRTVHKGSAEDEARRSSDDTRAKAPEEPLEAELEHARRALAQATSERDALNSKAAAMDGELRELRARLADKDAVAAKLEQEVVMLKGTIEMGRAMIVDAAKGAASAGEKSPNSQACALQ